MRETIADYLTYLVAVLFVIFMSLWVWRGYTNLSHPTPDGKQKTQATEATTPPSPSRVSEKQIEWAARAIYSETKNSTDMEYWGWLIRNRLKSKDYPGSVREVVLQPSQFSAFNNWNRRQELMQLSYPETKDTHFRRAFREAHYILTSADSMNPMPDVLHAYNHPTQMKRHGSPPDWARSGTLFFSTDSGTRYYTDVRPPSTTSTLSSYAR